MQATLGRLGAAATAGPAARGPDNRLPARGPGGPAAQARPLSVRATVSLGWLSDGQPETPAARARTRRSDDCAILIVMSNSNNLKAARNRAPGRV